jgi:hypothetical protein
MSKKTVTCADWHELRRNTLQGFATIKIDEMKLVIRDVAIHEKNGQRWAQLPAKPQVRDGKLVTDAVGKIQYLPIMEFVDRETRDAFSRAVCAAVVAHEPQAFSSDNRAAAFDDEIGF